MNMKNMRRANHESLKFYSIPEIKCIYLTDGKTDISNTQIDQWNFCLYVSRFSFRCLLPFQFSMLDK